MWIIIVLILVGALLLVAELVLLPGLSVAGIAALIAYGIAIYLGFVRYDTTGGIVVIASVVAISVVTAAISLRAKTWQRLSLNNKIESTSQQLAENELNIGDRGLTVTRLAPIGKVVINGETYEAKSMGDLYIDPQSEIEVVGFENFNVIVKSIN